MSKLGQVTTGKIHRPVLVLLYGPDGVGKSTFGSEAPSPIFLGPVQGTDNLDVARYPEPTSWTDVLYALDDLATAEHQYKSLVVDSLDWIEPLLFAQIIKEDAKGAKTIETACGGYGKGYTEAEVRWKDEFIKRLNVLREKRKMNIILVAHSDVVNFSDPQTQTEYKRYELKLHKKASAKFREYVDAVLFATYEIFIKKDKDSDKVKTFGQGDRVMLTEKRPAYDAKNRYGLEHELRLGWNDLVEAISKGNPESLDVLHSKLKGMVEVITDADLKQTVIDTVKKAEGNAAALKKIIERLAQLQGEPEGVSA